MQLKDSLSMTFFFVVVLDPSNVTVEPLFFILWFTSGLAYGSGALEKLNLWRVSAEENCHVGTRGPSKAHLGRRPAWWGRSSMTPSVTT